MLRFLAILLLACAWASVWGCTSHSRGSTVFLIKAADRDEEIAIRRKLPAVQGAVQEAIIAYGLERIAIEVIVREMGGLGQTTPTVDGLLRVDSARVVINKRLLLDPPDDLDDVLLGLMAHELAHALHYSRMTAPELANVGELYRRFMNSPEGSLQPWARAYEQFTDLTAIVYGFGDPLIRQKRASAENLARNHPKKVWDFYLREDDIHTLMGDPDALREALDRSARATGVGSLRRLGDRMMASLPRGTPHDALAISEEEPAFIDDEPIGPWEDTESP
ncbi:MAG: hypothetical protein H6811_01730 [Phycisphaeraceae bacterium]|nr:hypothetical protein [Phycisphaeraceae bacterium]